ncbi:spore germination protein XA [Clostridium tepidiprofundi DSM 19306]|uniref:Spore germination protein XA n=1 Tax=Clostridium tepidiprofundi DSM 19306 TaxID=1121338 RepID=A0A151AW82_9CLOT|nr:spore germination protein [Clostridium tepidiprofundi]KYH31667.1 spore germination protein XA [Clostridium tepidiprofundi DSM 19306]
MVKNNFLRKIQENRKSLDISLRRLKIYNNEIYITYIPQITDKNRVSNDIIRPILQYGKDKLLTIDMIMESVIYIDDVNKDYNEDKIIDYILQGKSIIIMTYEDKYIVCDTTKVEKRQIQAPTLEDTIRNPRDCFTENMDSNLSLIRYRIKDENLKIDDFTVGKRTKTKVAVVYIKDVANDKYVNDIKNRIKKIKTDGILDSGNIQRFIVNNSMTLFPEIGIIERSDKACTTLLDGKVCIIVEGSNIVLSAPKVFSEFLDSSDDYNDSVYWAIFSKFIRISSLLMSLELSALYVATIAFHPDALPGEFIMALASSRETVPFNALTEAFLMELVAEVLREASMRLPKQIGTAIGIVGTIVIGQAAVSAGLVSPLMVIIVSLSTMCSFVAGDYTIMNSIRILKFFMIFITGMLGLFGFVIGITFIAINLISTSSFGVPYLAPIAPLNFKDFRNYFLSDRTLAKKRPKFLKTKDNTRQ